MWITVLVVLATGFALRTAQFAGQVDLWHDELALARNIEDRGLKDLVSEPLDHEQVAPIGFLVLLEVSSKLLGVTEIGLRFAPWLLSLASMLLFWRVATRFAQGLPIRF